MDRLEAFETMREEILKQAETEQNRMDQLRAQGKEKSATYRQYLGNRLFYSRVKDLYRKYGLLEETKPSEKETD
ncbi:MAG: hypothetical protein IJ201_00715 [Solobacterium sp.]|jgi:hypothetical protein|nr:hypothetical protein [Solobacterium sp.]